MQLNTEIKNARHQKILNFKLPFYTLSEEIMSSITHGLGVFFSVVALVLLIIKSPKDFQNIFSISIYGATLIILYTISTIYHALKINRAKKVFRKLDHCSIFLLIAGTYTPICALLLRGNIGTIILCCVWVTAILGVVLNSIDVNKFSKFSLACYLVMGWAVVFAIKPLIASITPTQMWWLFAGGAFYTIGAIIYVIGKKIRYMHSVWHLFVLAGSICHFMMIY